MFLHQHHPSHSTFTYQPHMHYSASTTDHADMNMNDDGSQHHTINTRKRQHEWMTPTSTTSSHESPHSPLEMCDDHMSHAPDIMGKRARSDQHVDCHTTLQQHQLQKQQQEQVQAQSQQASPTSLSPSPSSCPSQPIYISTNVYHSNPPRISQLPPTNMAFCTESIVRGIIPRDAPAKEWHSHWWMQTQI